MSNLGDVLVFIVDGLDNGAFAQQNPVIHRPESALHVGIQLGYQLYAFNKELVEKILVDITLVAD